MTLWQIEEIPADSIMVGWLEAAAAKDLGGNKLAAVSFTDGVMIFFMQYCI